MANLYDVSKCTISFLGISIEDFGDYVAKIEFLNDYYKRVKMERGGNYSSRTNNNGGRLTISLVGGTETLNNMLKAMDLSKLLDVGFGVAVLDNNENADSYVLQECLFERHPTVNKQEIVESVEIAITFGKHLPQTLADYIGQEF